MNPVPTVRYYERELRRRIAHYAEKRRSGFRYRGSLERAAHEILTERAARGFESGGHFRGVWPRDLCFGARGLSISGFDAAVRETGAWLIDQLSADCREAVFYTDFHEGYCAATPAEGVDTFPALVILLSECGGLRSYADELERLAERHREKFFDEERAIVSGSGSSWWDSARRPRETYNTAMLLAATERLERRDIETAFTGRSSEIRDGLVSTFWNGSHFAERRGSPTLACDANVIPLYFGLLEDERARTVAKSLGKLETSAGLRMRARPFGRTEVHPFFALHRDYHYHVWPWNSFMYAVGLERYGFDDRARAEVDRIERRLSPYGNFLEVLTLEGGPYVKRGYASAEDFTVAAALWTEYVRGSD